MAGRPAKNNKVRRLITIDAHLWRRLGIDAKRVGRDRPQLVEDVLLKHLPKFVADQIRKSSKPSPPPSRPSPRPTRAKRG